jgi:hypothetical protein
MIEPNNGNALSPKDNRLLAPKGSQARYTGELLLRTRPKTYRAIVRELAEPNASVNGIARGYRVSNHTVMGIRDREAKDIAEREKNLVSILADVATVGAERMSEKIGKASLRGCNDRNRGFRGQDRSVDRTQNGFVGEYREHSASNTRGAR